MTLVRCLTLTLLLALLLGACSSENRKREYYGATELKPLQIPDGFSNPTSGGALTIPTPAMPLSAMPMDTKPPRITSTTAGMTGNSSFIWSVKGLYLMVDDTADSVHRRLGLVIQRAGMKRVRVDEKGVYRFDYYQDFEDESGFFNKLAFWNRDETEDYSGAYQTFTEPDGEKTRVYIKYADGTDCEPDAAEHVLEVIRNRLG